MIQTDVTKKDVIIGDNLITYREKKVKETTIEASGEIYLLIEGEARLSAHFLVNDSTVTISYDCAPNCNYYDLINKLI